MAAGERVAREIIPGGGGTGGGVRGGLGDSSDRDSSRRGLAGAAAVCATRCSVSSVRSCFISCEWPLAAARAREERKNDRRPLVKTGLSVHRAICCAGRGRHRF
eukprot:scaffold4896_cov84-Isochrysis_galbana.AAC.2